MFLSPRRAVLAAALTIALSGCASLAPRPGDDAIQALLGERGGPAVDWSAVGQPEPERRAISQWLDEEMSVDTAVRVAMLRSPRLQQEYARMGLARAEVLEAVQIANPRLHLSRQYSDAAPGYSRTAGLSMPLVDLLVLPVRARLAGAEFERAQMEIAAAVLAVASDVETAWYRHVAAQQVAEMRTAVAEGADASAELAQRFFDAGNLSELQLKQEQAAASSARIDAARARADAIESRLELNTLLGLSGEEADWATSDRLPLPVDKEDEADVLVALVLDSNLELLAARRQAEVLADALGITRGLRWLGGSEIGYERETEADGTRLRGPSLSLELPLFNQGQARLARAEAHLAGALARVHEAELAAHNGVRLGSQRVQELRSVVDIHRQALIPQREKVVERSQQEYNFMLVGVFELIQAKVKEYDAYQGYLEALRDYWLARVELSRVVGQRLPSGQEQPGPAPSISDILDAGPAVDHSGHGNMDHSGHEGMDHSKHEAMDHSGHEGMDHSADEKTDQTDHSDHRSPAPAAEVDDQPEDDHHRHHDGATP
jgi:outer membrane protein TolC